MDHREFFRSLSPEQRERLTEKSDVQGLAHLALHWSAIAGVGTLIVMRVPGWQALIVIQGILIIFLFTLLHETSHQTVFRTARLNSAVAYVCGFLIFLPANWFRYFHFAHHRYTQEPERDPELAEGKPESLSAYVLLVSGLPVWRGHLQTLFRNALGRCDDAYVPVSKLRRVCDEARIMLVAYALIALLCLYLGFSELIFVWLLPLLAGQPFLRLYLLAEHGRCPFVANMFENTRTTFTNFLVLKLAWNMPYHAEHHTCPTVPFYRLPDLHELAREHLRVTEKGYIRFHKKYVSQFE